MEGEGKGVREGDGGGWWEREKMGVEIKGK